MMTARFRLASVGAAALVLSAASARGQTSDEPAPLPEQLIAEGFRLTKTVKRPDARHWDYYAKGDEIYICDFGEFDTTGCRPQD